MSDLTVIILTYNEEAHISRAISSVKGFSKRVIVVDSFSTDRTLDIAREAGAEVFQNKFVHQAQQFQWALDNVSLDTAWIMRLDADEVIEVDLQKKIGESIGFLPADVVGIRLKRKHVFLGRWIRHGGRYPIILTRLWRVGYGRVENRFMDEHVVTWGGRTILFEGGFLDWNLNSLSYFIDKHNKYATREAIQILVEKYQLVETEKEFGRSGLNLQAGLKRVIKNRVYNRLNFFVSSTAYFVWRYIFQLGFLDGKEGVIYHFLQGYWYRFLVGARVLELEREIKGALDPQDVKIRIKNHTGYSID